MTKSKSMILSPDTPDTRKALNTLARHQTIINLEKDIMIDLMICELEGWDKLEFIKQIYDLLKHFKEINADADSN